MEEFVFTAKSADQNERADRFLAANMPGMTRSALAKLFDAGKILINGKPEAKHYLLSAGDTVGLSCQTEADFAPQPLKIPLDIFYEDEYLLVVNKPRGMLAHPAEHEQDTLANALLYHCGGKLSTIGGAFRPGIVHRIDKDTSGLLVAAKTDEIHAALAKQVESHSMLRVYEGVVHGVLKDDAGIIKAPIGRNPARRTKLCVLENGRPAVTRYCVLEWLNGFTHLEMLLETGRTHQIRVHMAYIGHPVAGDPVYGPKNGVKRLNGQCLHAKTLGFIHPITGEELVFTAPLPGYFTDFLAKIKPV